MNLIKISLCLFEESLYQTKQGFSKTNSEENYNFAMTLLNEISELYEDLKLYDEALDSLNEGMNHVFFLFLITRLFNNFRSLLL